MVLTARFAVTQSMGRRAGGGHAPRSVADGQRVTGGPVTVVGRASRRVALPSSVVAVRTARTHLAGFLQECGVTDGVIDDAVVIVSELVTNAVRHAAPPEGSLRVEWALEPRRLRLRVIDGGRTGWHRGLHDQGAVGGRGLSIVAALSDSWSLERADRGTTVTAVLVLP